MTPIERAGYLAHSHLFRFRHKIALAEECIREALVQCANPYCAFSLGKDSAVLLNLCAGVRSNITARTLTSGETRLLHPDLDNRIEEWAEIWPCVHFQEINIDRVFDGAESTWHDQRKAGRGDIRNLLPGDHDAVFMGLRDEESNARRHANAKGLIRRYSDNRKDNCAGMLVCCPLARWTTTDIAAYIVSRDLPLLDAYRRPPDGTSGMGMETRTTARLTGDAVRQNSLQAIRLRDPDSYNRIMKRFPEISWWAG